MVAAPPDRPLVVVAGAGSGKTETMAARVSWLVANRLVEPEAILGLTFTRKAASELNERVRLRLGALARHPDTDDDLRRAARHRRSRRSRPTTATPPRWSPSTGCGSASSPAPACSGRRCAGGRRPPSSSAWTGDMSDVPLTLLTTVEDVLALAAELGEHDIEPGGAARLDRSAGGADRRLRRRPAASGARTRPSREMLARQRARVALLPLVEAFEARKRAAGAIDYADQVAYAARIAVASRRGRPP